MLLGPPPPRTESRCFWWEEPRWVVLRRSPWVQAVLAAAFLFYCVVPPLTGRPLVESVVTSTVLVAAVIATFFYRRRIAIDPRGIWLTPVSPLVVVNPMLTFLSAAGMRQIAMPEIKGVRIMNANANRPAEMIVSRKYAKPYTVVIAPSVSTAALGETLQEFGFPVERDVD